MKINILDCTLRDGGYMNDWAFSNKEITHILQTLEESKVEVIECGYLDSKRGQTENSTLFDTLETVDALLKNYKLTTQKVVMINLGDYEISELKPKNETLIDGIRLAFHKKDLNEALLASEIIKDLGYKLYFQPMVTKNYKDVEFLAMIEKANKVNPHAFYIVDSFGSMSLDEFNKYLILSHHNLETQIQLGYHSHNNMQLAFSNAVSMCTANMQRDLILDASIYGIGRGAGNLNTELITDYLNSAFSKQYNILPLLECIDELLSSMMQKNPWGFSPAQYLSASLNCHPNYATYLINKNTKHIVGVQKILEKLPSNKKSSFDKGFIENLYVESLLEIKTALRGTLDIDKKVLLVASGRSVQKYKDTIEKRVADEDYTVIALNHKPSFDCDYYFFSNQKRFDEFSDKVEKNKIVITSNIFTNIDLNIVLDFKNLVFIDDRLVTNVAMVALNYLVYKSIADVEVAGLDGYRVDIDNYNYQETTVITDTKELMEQNSIIGESLKSLSQKIDIKFLTPTIFYNEAGLC